MTVTANFQNNSTSSAKNFSDKGEDKTPVYTYAVLNSIQYSVVEINDGIVFYEPSYEGAKIRKEKINNFDLIYQDIWHEHVETKIIHLNEKKYTPDAVNYNWAEEMDERRISYNSAVLSQKDFFDAFETLYPERITDKFEGTEQLLLDFNSGWVRIGGIKIIVCFDAIYEITSIFPEDNPLGNRYILEIAEYFNKKNK